jgi:hypothetical protein
MTREQFIKKWLDNKDYQYTEQNRDLMRDDLDKVINKALPQADVSGRSEQFNCGKERVFGEQKCDKQCDECLKEYGSN